MAGIVAKAKARMGAPSRTMRAAQAKKAGGTPKAAQSGGIRPGTSPRRKADATTALMHEKAAQRALERGDSKAALVSKKKALAVKKYVAKG